jgi:hypothetical protein
MTPEEVDIVFSGRARDRGALAGLISTSPAAGAGAACGRPAGQRARAATDVPVSRGSDVAAGGHVVMPKSAAAAGTVLSFPAGPGIVVVLLPSLLTRLAVGRTIPAPDTRHRRGPDRGRRHGDDRDVRFPAEGTGMPFPANPPSSRQVIVGPAGRSATPMHVAFHRGQRRSGPAAQPPGAPIHAAALLASPAASARFYEKRTLIRNFRQRRRALRQLLPVTG